MTAPLVPSMQSITPRGLLSFGPDTPPLELRPLNVLIGPNASGKSNLIDLLRLVRSMPSDMQEPIRGGGGIEGWLWKGADPNAETSLELIALPAVSSAFYHHRLVFIGTPSIHALFPQSEVIAVGDNIFYQSDFMNDRIRMLSSNGELADTPHHKEHRHDQSALAQFRSIRDYPQITWLSFMYERIRIYGTWESGRDTSLRRAQPADRRGDVLEEDCSNLGLFLNQTLGTAPAYKRQVVEGMKELYSRFTNYEIVVNSGSVQIFFTEEDTSIPATRLSDGALRYLCLLAILYNPKPPPVVCMEEPELGLHPDIVAGLAKHLRAASERMQLIVTTHSDILIDALSDTPESIVVFENNDGATRMNRLDADGLSEWLEDYRLGQLWTSGQIGGTRW